MIKQTVLKLSPKRRGCHLITSEIMSGIPQPLPETGLLNLFVQHTSCALTINENADPDVRGDMTRIMDCLVCEGEPYYEHTLEGARRYASPCQVVAFRCERYDSNFRTSPCSWHMAGHLPLRIPRFRRQPKHRGYRDGRIKKRKNACKLMIAGVFYEIASEY